MSVDSLACVRTWTGTTGLTIGALTPAGNELYVGCTDGVIRKSKLPQSTDSGDFSRFDSSSQCRDEAWLSLSLSPSGHLLAGCCEDNYVLLFELPLMRRLCTVKRFSLPATACDFISTSLPLPNCSSKHVSVTLLVCAAASGKVCVTLIPEHKSGDALELECMHEFECHPSGVANLKLCAIQSEAAENNCTAILMFASDCNGAMHIWQVLVQLEDCSSANGDALSSDDASAKKSHAQLSAEPLMTVPSVFPKKRGAADISRDPQRLSIALSTSTKTGTCEVHCCVSADEFPKVYLFEVTTQQNSADAIANHSTCNIRLKGQKALCFPVDDGSLPNAQVTVCSFFHPDTSGGKAELLAAGFSDGSVRLFDVKNGSGKDDAETGGEFAKQCLIGVRKNKGGSGISSIQVLPATDSSSDGDITSMVNVVTCDCSGDLTAFGFERQSADVKIGEKLKKAVDNANAATVDIDMDDDFDLDADSNSLKFESDDEEEGDSFKLKTKSKEDSVSVDLGALNNVNFDEDSEESPMKKKKASSKMFSVAKLALTDEAEEDAAMDVEMDDATLVAADATAENSTTDSSDLTEKSQKTKRDSVKIKSQLAADSDDDNDDNDEATLDTWLTGKSKEGKGKEDTSHWIVGADAEDSGEKKAADDTEMMGFELDADNDLELLTATAGTGSCLTSAAPMSLSSRLHPCVYNSCSGSLASIGSGGDVPNVSYLVSNEIGNLICRRPAMDSTTTSVGGTLGIAAAMGGGFEYEVEFADKVAYSRSVRFRQATEFPMAALSTRGLLLVKSDLIRYRPYRMPLAAASFGSNATGEWTHVLTEDAPVCAGLSRDYCIVVTTAGFVRLFTTFGLQCEAPFCLDGNAVNVCCSPYHNVVLIVFQKSLLSLSCLVFDLGSRHGAKQATDGFGASNVFSTAVDKSDALSAAATGFRKARVIFNGCLPLTNGAPFVDDCRLIWTHVSRKGRVLTLDSNFVLRVLVAANNGANGKQKHRNLLMTSWIPLMNLETAVEDYRRRAKSEAAMDAATAIDDELQSADAVSWPIFFDDCSNSLMVSLNFPKSAALSELKCALPMLDSQPVFDSLRGVEEQSFGSREEEIVRERVLALDVLELEDCSETTTAAKRRPAAERVVKLQLKQHLQLFQIACQMKRTLLAQDIAEEYLSRHEKALVNAKRIAMHFSLPKLANKINAVLIAMADEKAAASQLLAARNGGSVEPRRLRQPMSTLKKMAGLRSATATQSAAGNCDAKEADGCSESVSPPKQALGSAVFAHIGKKRSLAVGKGEDVVEANEVATGFFPAAKKAKRNPFSKKGGTTRPSARSRPQIQRQRSLFDV